jgi:hypothetical protein
MASTGVRADAMASLTASGNWWGSVARVEEGATETEDQGGRQATRGGDGGLESKQEDSRGGGVK